MARELGFNFGQNAFDASEPDFLRSGAFMAERASVWAPPSGHNRKAVPFFVALFKAEIGMRQRIEFFYRLPVGRFDESFFGVYI